MPLTVTLTDPLLAFAEGGFVDAVTVGAVKSSLTVTLCETLTFPATSLAEKVIVVVPWFSVKEAVPPFTVVDPIVVAPEALYVMLATPDTESLPVMVKAPLQQFHPAPFANGVSATVGAEVSSFTVMV
jgi:hypothetical protein